MKTLTSQLHQFILNQEKEIREKKSFWATDSEKDIFELYHKFKGTPETNPPDANKLITFDAGKRMEESVVDMFRLSHLLVEGDEIKGLKWIEEEDQYRFDFTIYQQEIPVSGKVDAIIKTDNHPYVPVEIKTFYGAYQEKELSLGKPRTSYLKQLAMYMWAMKVSCGILLYRDRGLGKMYEFILVRDETEFSAHWYKEEMAAGVKTLNCIPTGISFDIKDIFERWKKTWKYIQNDEEPDPEKKYKYDLEKIDWKSLSKSDITKARNNQAVIGDWEVQYSPYKKLYIDKVGDHLGYNDDEISFIKEKTKGYTNW